MELTLTLDLTHVFLSFVAHQLLHIFANSHLMDNALKFFVPCFTVTLSC